jgi:hypothetical protein
MKQDNAQPQQSTPTPPGKVITVKVVAEAGGEDGVQFGHKWRFDHEPQENEQSDDIWIPKRAKKDPGTTIRFKLHDKSGLGLQFDRSDPMWVDRNLCPQSSSEDTEIPKSAMSATDDELTVFNQNNENCTLNYALQFKDCLGKCHPYDPRIRNGGTM